MSSMATFMRAVSFESVRPSGTDKKTQTRSLWAVRLGLLADAMSTMILWPNYAFLATPDATDSSFESTKPFEFNGATYFLSMAPLLSTAIMSCLMGHISDRFGRRPSMILCVGVSILLTIAKYLLRGNFWTFSAASFVNGFFAGTLPVALAYAADVSPNRVARDVEMSLMFSIYFIGQKFGGVTTILLGDYNLFTPLLAGAALNLMAFVPLVYLMVEPRNVVIDKEQPDDSNDDRAAASDDDGAAADDDVGVQAPVKLNKPLVSGICIISILDDIGGNGIFPLTMTPLAFKVFYSDFIDAGEEPIMQPDVYRWVYTLVGFMSLLGTVATRPIFRHFGVLIPAMGGNLLAVVGPILCLFIADMEPTRSTLSVYLVLVFLIYPVSIFNIAANGLILDRVTPLRYRGMVQGINVAGCNFCWALAGFILGIYADATAVVTMILTVSAIALTGGVLKIPLIFREEFKHKENRSSDSLLPVEFYSTGFFIEDDEEVPSRHTGRPVPMDADPTSSSD